MAFREEKQIKGIQTGKEVKLTVCRSYDTIHRKCKKKKKKTTRKLLELISEFSKVMGYKVNTQKSLAVLYTNNEKSERN